jgi:ATP-binding cassette subfamily C protein LapB
MTNETSPPPNSSDELLRAAQRGRHDPLLSCLIEVARLHGRSMSPDSFLAGLPLPEGRLTPSVFRRAAARAGLASRVSKRPLEKIYDELLPVILLLTGNDACTLLGWNKERTEARVVFSEAGQGESTITLERLAERYGGFCIFARPRFRFDQRTPVVGRVVVRHWFWGAFAENWGLYKDVLLAALVINLAAVALPLFTMNVYDRVVPNKAVETLWALSVGMTLLLLWDFGLRMMRGYFVDLASKRIDISLSTLIMERVLGMRMEVRPVSVGSFASNLRAFESVRDFIASATVTALIDVPFAVIFVLVIAWLGWQIAIPVLVGIALIIGYAFFAQVKMLALTESSYRAAAQRNATLIESLTGLETIKAQNAEGVMQRKWEQSVAFLARVNADLRLLSNSVVTSALTIQQLVTISVIIIGVYLIGENLLTLGGLIACSMLSSRAIAPLSQVAALMIQYENAVLALTSLDQVMKQPVERPDDATFVRREHFQGAIEFDKVSFTYPNEERQALREVSFRIKPGEHVGILGRVGSGKSTINKLIMGLYQASEGTIKIDGVDIRQLDPAELRRAIGYMPQEVTLFYGSLRDNIAIGTPYAEDAAILQAIDTAGARKFVANHPRGVDMRIGERGDSLSGGQRQAVAIGRALLHEPTILMLDEPTNSMDFSTEEALKQELRVYAAHHTMILVTHRNSMMELVDRMIVIEDGRILIDGPKQQVIDALKSGKVQQP